MKKAHILTLALLSSANAMAAEQDSIYAWGQWSKGIQPAAGPVAKVTPPPAKTPAVNFRPNETAAFLREAVAFSRPAPPVMPSAPQVPNIVIAPTNTDTTPRTSL